MSEDNNQTKRHTHLREGWQPAPDATGADPKSPPRHNPSPGPTIAVPHPQGENEDTKGHKSE